VAWLAGFLDEFERAFEVVPLGRHAEALEAAPHLPLRAPRSNLAPDPYAARFGPADRSGRRGDEEGVVSADLINNSGWVCCQSKTPISAYRLRTLQSINSRVNRTAMRGSSRLATNYRLGRNVIGTSPHGGRVS
jgi:hypothetical protein